MEENPDLGGIFNVFFHISVSLKVSEISYTL